MFRPISFSLYLDFLLASGAARYTAAHTASGGAPVDFYGGFKATVSRVLGGERDAFERLMAGCAGDEQRLRLYPALVKGFEKWIEKNPIVGSSSRCQLWQPVPTVIVAVNPEVCGVIGGVPHVIKLHTRKGTPGRTRVELAVAVLRDAFPGVPGTVYGVLDVRAGKLHTVAPGGVLERSLAVARAEAEAFAVLRSAQVRVQPRPLKIVRAA